MTATGNGNPDCPANSGAGSKSHLELPCLCIDFLRCRVLNLKRRIRICQKKKSEAGDLVIDTYYCKFCHLTRVNIKLL